MARYLGTGKDSLLASSVARRLAEALRLRAQAYGLSAVRIAALGARDAPPNPLVGRCYVLDTRLGLDSDRQVTIKSELLRTVDGTVIVSTDTVFTSDAFRIEWADLESAAEYETPLSELATQIADKIEYPAYRWLIDAAFRFVVRVEPFVNRSLDPGNDYLGDVLAVAVQTELAQSPTMSLIKVDTAARGAAVLPAGGMQGVLPASYTVGGTFTVMGGKLRIDVDVLKHSVNRILASRHALLDSVDLGTLSTAMARLGREVRWAMEADFRQQKKALAVLGVPMAHPLSMGRPPASDVAVAGELARVLARKVSRLTVADNPLLELLVREPAITESPGSAVDPFGWLVALDADYLVLVTYQDLGDQVRLSTDLTFYDPERPGIRLPLQDRIVDKADIETVINVSVVELVKQLGRLAATRREVTDTVGVEVSALLASIPMHSIVRERQVGFRFGAVFGRPDTGLFFGDNAGNYLEFYVSRMLPVISRGRANGMFATALELALGVDFGEDLSLGGAAVASGLVNGKIYLTPWKYSRTTLNAAVGGGVGLMGLRYSFSPGDRHFVGTEPFRDTAFVFATNLFGLIEGPLWSRFEGDLLLRWVPATSGLNGLGHAAAAGVEGSDFDGSLGGVSLMAGMKVRF